MRILKLEILNLASLDKKDGEVIDFEAGALKNSSLFSIVGPTGSGKSTILDAICLALFNRAPRYPKQKGARKQFVEIYGERDDDEKKRIAPTDCRNILSHGKKNGYSKLTFLANNGFVYRAEWSVRFKTKVYEDAATSLVRLENAGGTINEVMCDWNDIPAIIGLEYEQFLRTVLIAQGSFANFLVASEDERYKLLEKLIGCEEMYKTIAAGIKEEKDRAEDELKRLETECSVYDKSIISADELEQIGKRIEELNEEKKRNDEELAQIAKALQWYKTEVEQLEKVESAKNNLAEAQGLMDGASADKESLALHDATVKPVSILSDARKTKKKVDKHSTDIETWEKSKEAIAVQIGEDEKKVLELVNEKQKAEEEYNLQKPHINAARTIKGELEGAENVRKEKLQARDDAKDAEKAAQEKVDDNAKKIEEAEKALADAKGKHEELEREVGNNTKTLQGKADGDREAYEKKNGLLESMDAQALQDAKSNAEQMVRDLNDAIRIETQRSAKKGEKKNNEETLRDLERQNNEIVKQLGCIDIETLEAELKTLQDAQTLMTSEDWNSHRNSLKDGEKCPLCGATEHPFCDGEVYENVVNGLNEMVGKQQKTVREARAEISRLEKEQSANSGKIDPIKKTNDRLKEELDALDAEWAELKKKHPELPEDVQTLDAMRKPTKKDLDDATKALGLHNNLADEVRELRKTMEASDKALSDYINQSAEQIRAAVEKVNKADTKWQTEKGLTENLVNQLGEKKEALQAAELALKNVEALVAEKREAFVNEIGDNDVDEFDKTLADAVKNVQKKETEAREALAKLRENQKSIEGQIENAKSSRDEEKAALADAKAEFDAWIADYNSRNENKLTIDDVAKISADNRDWESLRKNINDLEKDLAAKTSALEVETNTYNKHQESKPESSQEELMEREAELKALDNEELTSLKLRKSAHDTAVDALGELVEEKDAAQTLVNEWNEIYKAIGANEGETLRKIAQCYTLRFLVEHANAEIRKFNSRYELVQVKNSLGLRVIDHNRADVVRDTTSLSGGETFIVSLGLALGLSSLSSRNVRFENLFIDEGFGTLDPDTLTTVIESLRMLQSSQGKKVCIISHTEKMRESIPTQIQIIKNGDSGSSHIEVYPY